MLTKIMDIKAKIAAVSEKIADRIEKSENESVTDSIIMFRFDPVISEAIRELHNLQSKRGEICINHHLSEDIYHEFCDEPGTIRKLELSEACARTRVYLQHNCYSSYMSAEEEESV